MADFDETWLLNQNAARCILVEAVARVSAVETVRYLSTQNYHDSTSSRVYNPIVIGSSVQVDSKMALEGGSSLSFGTIDLDNTNGDIDAWLDDIWTNRNVNVYLGDVTWARSSYVLLFSGVVEDIDSKDNGTLSIKIRDKLERLNAPVSEEKLGGGTENKNELIPLAFGEVHNLRPLLTNPSTLEYQYHNGPSERVIEVRSNGVPVTNTPSLSTGKFTLSVNPQSATITASVQGDKPNGTYTNTVGSIIQRLVTGYGSNTRFTSGDLDAASLATFEAANTQAIGVYLSGRENVRSLCNDIAATIGSQMVMTRAGKMKLIKLELPAPGTPFEITTADIYENTLKISERLLVEAAQKIGYNKNWTVQDALDTGIPQEHKDLFAKEWKSVVSEDATTKTVYKLSAEPVQKDTYLLTEAEATTEAARLRDLYKTPRNVFVFEGKPRLVELQLGDAVTLTHPRFDLAGGVNGMVIGMQVNWDTLDVRVEVLT